MSVEEGGFEREEEKRKKEERYLKLMLSRMKKENKEGRSERKIL